jgi:hypothetical protein
MALKAGNTVPAADVNGKVMNSMTKTKKCSNLANGEREKMQMRTLSLGWASNPPNVGRQLGIPRSQARVYYVQMQSFNGEGVGPFENSLKRFYYTITRPHP